MTPAATDAHPCARPPACVTHLLALPRPPPQTLQGPSAKELARDTTSFDAARAEWSKQAVSARGKVRAKYRCFLRCALPSPGLSEAEELSFLLACGRAASGGWNPPSWLAGARAVGKSAGFACWGRGAWRGREMVWQGEAEWGLLDARECQQEGRGRAAGRSEALASPPLHPRACCPCLQVGAGGDHKSEMWLG